MNIVLLSGGSGKRLWPLSNEIRSKQFLRVIEKDNREVQSMLQRVFGQIQEVQLSDNIIITTSKLQEDSIRNQLGSKATILLEPERRDTFPAILLSCAYLFLEQEKKYDECVVILPVDPYVDIDYFYTIKTLEEYVQKGDSDIILVGVNPTYPSEKYGYIITQDTGSICEKVLEFKEKPNLTEVKKLLECNAKWNCGVFAFKLGYIIEILKKYINFTNYEDVLKQYGKLKKISFDYEVVEKADSVSVITYYGQWKDIGTWNTLSEIMKSEPLGNAIIDETCNNTHVINELDIPVIVMGIDNVIVAASPDGILVSDKQQSSYLKKYTNSISQRPMFEEKDWGEYKVLDISIGEDGIKALTKRKFIKAGKYIPYQLHNNRSEVLTILSGECVVKLDGKEIKAKAGDSFSIEIGVKHQVYAITSVELIEIQVGFDLLEDGTEILEE